MTQTVNRASSRDPIPPRRRLDIALFVPILNGIPLPLKMPTRDVRHDSPGYRFWGRHKRLAKMMRPAAERLIGGESQNTARRQLSVFANEVATPSYAKLIEACSNVWYFEEIAAKRRTLRTGPLQQFRHWNRDTVIP